METKKLLPGDFEKMTNREIQDFIRATKNAVSEISNEIDLAFVETHRPSRSWLAEKRIERRALATRVDEAKAVLSARAHRVQSKKSVQHEFVRVAAKALPPKIYALWYQFAVQVSKGEADIGDAESLSAEGMEKALAAEKERAEAAAEMYRQKNSFMQAEANAAKFEARQVEAREASRMHEMNLARAAEKQREKDERRREFSGHFIQAAKDTLNEDAFASLVAMAKESQAKDSEGNQ